MRRGQTRPTPNSVVKPVAQASPPVADDTMWVHRLEACATRGKEDAAGAQVENLCHH